jgi:hypothetical protein
MMKREGDGEGNNHGLFKLISIILFCWIDSYLGYFKAGSKLADIRTGNK